MTGLKLCRAIYGISTTLPLHKRQSLVNQREVLSQVHQGAKKPRTCKDRILIRMNRTWKFVFDVLMNILVAYSCFVSIYLYHSTEKHVEWRFGTRTGMR